MKGKRKRHSAQFKAKVGLEALKGRKTIQEIAKSHGIHPTQVSQWKQEIAKRLPEVFESPSRSGSEGWEKERERLHAKIGQQSVEIDWLVKKCEQLHL